MIHINLKDNEKKAIFELKETLVNQFALRDLLLFG
jgi:hypothetical protein